MSGSEQGVDTLPLSEDEQRILSEIEQQFYASDPALAKEIADSTIYRHAARAIKWAVLAFVLGVVMLLGTLHISFLLSFGGFLVMLAAALIIERNARKMGRAGLEQLASSMKANGLRDAFGSSSERLRERFRRED
jgi:hypothetical protein